MGIIGLDSIKLEKYINLSNLPLPVKRGLEARAFVRNANTLEFTKLHEALASLTKQTQQKATILLQQDQALLEGAMTLPAFKQLPPPLRHTLKFLIKNKTLERAQHWISCAPDWTGNQLFQSDILNLEVTDKKFALYYLATANAASLNLSRFPLIYTHAHDCTSIPSLTKLSFYDPIKKAFYLLNGGYILGESIAGPKYTPTDCSGFVMWLYKINHHFKTRDYAKIYQENAPGSHVCLGNKTLQILGGYENLKMGDLINWRFLLNEKEDGHIVVFLSHLPDGENYIALECAYAAFKKLEGVGVRIFSKKRSYSSLGFFRVIET